MNVLITGSRQWMDVEIMRAILQELPRDTQLIHGGARGADVLCSLLASELSFPKPHVVRPEYDYWRAKIGKAGNKVAPLKRNCLMLDGKTTEDGPVDAAMIPDLVVSFFMTDQETGGTARCVEEARKRSIPVIKCTALMLPEEARAIFRAECLRVSTQL